MCLFIVVVNCHCHSHDSLENKLINSPMDICLAKLENNIVEWVIAWQYSQVLLLWTPFQYYLKTGTCKFGATCKFHHPKDKAGIAGRVSLNILGYPLRPVWISFSLTHLCCKLFHLYISWMKFYDLPFLSGQNEIECAYYLRTGQCKFGNTCKFHHPQPSNMMVSLRGSPVYPGVQSPTTPGQQSYQGGITTWPLSRASFIPSPRWQGPSSYTPLILPQGVVSVPSWNTYSVSSFPYIKWQQH